jgi:hypothetical protein
MGRIERVRRVLVDAVAPIAIYYGLGALGVANLPALLTGAAVPAIDAGLRALIAWRMPLRQPVILVHAPFPVTAVAALLIGRLLLLPAVRQAMQEPRSLAG